PTNTAERTDLRTVSQLAYLNIEDFGLTFAIQVVGDGAAGDATADDHRPHSLCLHSDLREVPTISGFSKRREGARCSLSTARKPWSPAAVAASVAPSRSLSRAKVPMSPWPLAAV